MKLISQEQIQAILQTVYQTNISAKDFDAIKQFFAQLPEEKKVEKKK